LLQNRVAVGDHRPEFETIEQFPAKSDALVPVNNGTTHRQLHCNRNHCQQGRKSDESRDRNG
jgi:hypothetical protein